MLEDREALLRAIFQSPEDDIPRLVYADWLEEHGWNEHADLIRLQCSLARRQPNEATDSKTNQRLAELMLAVNRRDQPTIAEGNPYRGFRACREVALSARSLQDPSVLRERSILARPEWFAARQIKIVGGLIFAQEQIVSLFELPCFEQVCELDLSGREFHLPLEHVPEPGSQSSIVSAEFDFESTIRLQGLNLLVNHPGACRLQSLLLYNNDLDNDAIEVLIRSPYLSRLKELGLSQGNRFRGRVWQRVLQHFGEQVVS